MAVSDSGSGAQLEIGHVLFMDVVGYSKLLLDEQREVQQELNDIVRSTEQFRAADETGKLVRLPTGDGMALVFFNSPEAPVQCAVEISKMLRDNPAFQLRMGIHSGPVNKIIDVNDHANVAGAGINIAQRVMDCADGSHILMSKRTAEDLSQSRPWRPFLHDLGECRVKHGVPLSLVNLYTDQVGNSAVPEKIKRAQEEQAATAAATKEPPVIRRRTVIIAAGVLIAIALAVAWFVGPRQSGSQKGIAVLPFENFSDDKANGYFADGIQDDVLTSLAKIRDLRVISRTSVEKYRGTKSSHNVAEIAKELGVTDVLEGSVRKAGDRVVLNVQLIDARQDRHLWANKYELSLQESLGIDGQIAGEIASHLGVKLSDDEAKRVSGKPTENTQAYDLYLQAKQFEFKPDTFLQDYKTAEQLYVQAITLDPNFALAHARLASTRARIFHFFEPTEAWSKSARAEADLALKLQPNLGEAHHALGRCYYWFTRDYPAALREFEIARTLSPNDSSIPWDIAAIKRRQGNWTEALTDYRHILELDPQNANVVRDLLYVYCAMRDWPNAQKTAERLLTLTPDSINAKAQIGYVEFWAKGTTERLKREMASIPAGKDPDGNVTTCRIDAFMIDRNANSADEALRASALESFAYFNAVDTPRSFLAGIIALVRGDNETARKELEHARDIFAASMQESPQVPEHHAFLGLTCALLGEKARAINEGKRGCELRPESQDALDGAVMSAVLALIYARVGENDLAIPLLDRLLKTPGSVDSGDYSITVNDLKYRWEWDPIRKDSRFQTLIESK